MPVRTDVALSSHVLDGHPAVDGRPDHAREGLKTEMEMEMEMETAMENRAEARINDDP